MLLSSSFRVLTPTKPVNQLRFYAGSVAFLLLLVGTAVAYDFVTRSQDAASRKTERATRVAILDFGDSNLARLSSDNFSVKLKQQGLSILDRDQVRAAARGA